MPNKPPGGTKSRGRSKIKGSQSTAGDKATADLDKRAKTTRPRAVRTGSK